MKDQIQQQENDEKDDRQNQLQPLFSTQSQLVLSRPLKGVIGWQSQLVVQELVCISNEAAVVGVFEIDVDVPSQGAIFISNHGRATRKGDARYLPQRNLSA
jgi:hypothetical protein